MFCAMMARAWLDWVAAGSWARAIAIATRTSGGRSVDVRTTSDTMLSKKPAAIPSV